ncbi:MAG: hypothetical protein K6F08_01585 [bacterium]|nr:hypothetical protein [bacterium]
MNQKIKAYIGFAIKGKKTIVGVDNIVLKNKSKVIIISPELSENSLNKLKQKTETKIIVLDGYLPEGVLALGITDDSLASEIIKQTENC